MRFTANSLPEQNAIASRTRALIFPKSYRQAQRKSSRNTSRASFLLALLMICAATFTTAQSDTNARDGFSALLEQHVVDGVVDYTGFRDKPALDTYIEYVANKTDVESLPLNEQLAFYINAYNALAIKGILNGKSPKSFFGRVGYFYNAKYIIAGKKTNLYDFEHKVIRPLGEPRIHFGLVCASTSCPKLRSEAYTPEALDRQLNESATDFINDTSKNHFDLEKDRAHLSKIFDWFKKDFEVDSSLQQYIAQFIQDETVKAKLSTNDFSIKHNKYDWSLNGKK